MTTKNKNPYVELACVTSFVYVQMESIKDSSSSLILKEKNQDTWKL